MKNFYKKFKNLEAFTLLETLASISILSMVVIGPLSVTISSSAYARNTKDIIVATYLAEEAVELLQNQYDSMYVYCRKNPTATDPGELCEPNLLETSTGQTAWRLFKDRLSGIDGEPTCYLPKDGNPYSSYPDNDYGNADGCAFDYIHMQATSTQKLERTISTSSDCKYLVPVATSTTTYVPTTVTSPAHLETSTSTSYICSGTPAHFGLGVVKSKEYKRTVTVDQLGTFESVPANQQYSDDLRITSNVEFRGSNGMPHTIKIVRFMHARP